ncbi:MAG: hypothetical protein QXW79_00710 [Thermoplasmata archaeon]
MEEDNIVQLICLSERNINSLVNIICMDFRLSKRSIPKCAAILKDLMKKNISRLSRGPRNRDELKQIVKYLNNLCINTVIEIITKKYSGKKCSQNNNFFEKGSEAKKIFRDSILREKRKNRTCNRRTTFPENINLRSCNDFSEKPPSQFDDNYYSYASAFENHLITNIPVGGKQPPYNNPQSQRDGQLEQRYQQMLNERKYGINTIQKPETPDFTLDGSGEKVRKQKMIRRMQEQQQNMMGQMEGMMGSGMPMGMGSIDMNDPYALLLGAGAPVQSTSQIMNNTFMQNTMLANQYNMDVNNQSMKAMQLQNDYEKKLAERKQMDIETNQPQQSSQNYDKKMEGMIGNQGFGMNYILPTVSMGNPQMSSLGLYNIK